MEEISQEILTRKGPRKTADVSPKVKVLLEQGKLETVNLTEWLVVDQVQLIQAVFPTLGLASHISFLQERMKSLTKPTTMKMVKLVGESLKEIATTSQELATWEESLQTHGSDLIRSYAPYLIPLEKEDVSSYLRAFKPYAADPHFGVREIAWMAARPQVAVYLASAIEELSLWTQDKDEKVRRFATEVCRPRGVWCKHIDALKEQPELAQAILHPLHADLAKYVQDSVGNWLNDAAKTRPDFVMAITELWLQQTDNKATQRIVKKARRSIR
ncbi:MAG: DNA alkylation repair protein [Bacteroidota bacterium]